MSANRWTVCSCGSKHSSDSLARGDLSASNRRQARKVYLAAKRTPKRGGKRQALREGWTDYIVTGC